MKGRTKVTIIVGIIVVLALVIGLIVTMAAGASADPNPITQSQMIAAVNQDIESSHENAVNNLLDKAVQKGFITDAEKSDILMWWQAKPDVLSQTKGDGRLAIAFVLYGYNQNFVKNMAAVLSLSESQVSDAMLKARSEMQNDAVSKLLQRAVANGKITPGQSDQINTWWLSRPAAMAKLGIAMGQPLGSIAKTFISKIAANLNLTEAQIADAFKQAVKITQNQNMQKLLDKAVQNGKITQDEAGQIQQWWNSRPDAVNKLNIMKQLRIRHFLGRMNRDQ